MTALYQIVFVLLGAIFFAIDARTESVTKPTLANEIQAQIQKQFGTAQVTLVGEPRLTRGEAPSQVQEVHVIKTDARGEATFRIRGDREAEGIVGFSAMVPVLLAKRRILPGEPLKAELFERTEINVATGMNREFRGVMLPQDTDLSKLEAKHTIVEGQYAMTTAVVRSPDVRRGEAVKIRLISGGIQLITAGVADESALIDAQLKVTTQKSKRVLTGKLATDGIVEVRL